MIVITSPSPLLFLSTNATVLLPGGSPPAARLRSAFVRPCPPAKASARSVFLAPPAMASAPADQ
eukprot:264572-Pyramimonas_sp.AAC.1